ncbi:MAG: nuclear transport factor 2 family protein [Gammaproteobacteria bacterium]
MHDIGELARRIERLETRAAIQELVSSYAIACDEQDIGRLRELFTEDAVFDSASGRMRAVGAEQVIAMLAGALANRGPSCHWTHDVIVHPDPLDPERAAGVVYSHAETTPDGVVSLAAMRYHDEYRRTGGTWRFRRREISYLYYLPAAEYPAGLGQPLRVHAGGTVQRADYPETSPVWQAFREEQQRRKT